MIEGGAQKSGITICDVCTNSLSYLLVISSFFFSFAISFKLTLQRKGHAKFTIPSGSYFVSPK